MGCAIFFVAISIYNNASFGFVFYKCVLPCLRVFMTDIPEAIADARVFDSG
jgi:hypothetical protein